MCGISYWMWNFPMNPHVRRLLVGRMVGLSVGHSSKKAGHFKSSYRSTSIMTDRQTNQPTNQPTTNRTTDGKTGSTNLSRFYQQQFHCKLIISKLLYHIQYKFFWLNEEKFHKNPGQKNWSNFGIALCWVKLLKPVIRAISMNYTLNYTILPYKSLEN